MTVRTRKLFNLIFCCSGLSVVLFLIAHMQSVVLAGDFRGNAWFPITNLNHGGFHSWRIDHITQLAAGLFGGFNPAERPTLGTIIFYLGTYLFLRTASQISVKNSPYLWLGSSIIVLCLLVVSGLDAVAVGSVAWIPAIAIMAYKSMSCSYQKLSLAALAVCAIETSWSANQTALLSVGIALWIARVLGSVNGDVLRKGTTVSVVALLPAIFVTFTAPTAELPHYPKSAHVLPLEDSYGTLRPLVGHAYPFETLDRPAAQTLYKDRALILMLVSIIGWLIAKQSHSTLAAHLTKMGGALAFLATLDTALPESWASIAPVASLARLLPGATNYSLTSMSLAFGTWLTASGCILSARLSSFFLLSLMALVITWFGSPQILAPTLRAQGAIPLGAQGPANLGAQSATPSGGHGPTQTQDLRTILLSPSVSIVRLIAQSGVDIHEWLDALRNLSHLPGTDHRTLNATVDISPAPTDAVLDQAKQMESVWRWSPRTGSQRGNEMLTIRFNAPLTIRGIELDPGPFFTDYPRGLRIHAGMCEPTSAPVVAEYAAWHGALRLTSDGIPYYSLRNDVNIVLNRPTVASCIFVYQTGQAQFDWSVSRVKILLENSLKVVP